jgi:hypothetical protein
MKKAPLALIALGSLFVSGVALADPPAAAPAAQAGAGAAPQVYVTHEVVVTGRAQVPIQIHIVHPSAAVAAGAAHEELRALFLTSSMPPALRGH